MNNWAWAGDFLDTWGAAMWRASWQAALLVGVAICIARAPLISATVRSWVWRVAYLKFLLALLPLGLPLAILPQASVDRTEMTIASSELGSARNSVLDSADRQGLTSHEAINHSSAETFGWSTWLCGGLFAVWFCGCAWRVRIAARGWREMLSIKCRGRVPPSCQLTRVYAELCQQMGIARPPRLLLANRIDGPMLVGGRRPAVLFPPDLLPSCTVDDVTLMLRHELAHYQRGDLGWSCLAAAVDVLFFFHPAVRLVHRHYAVAQEVACDRLALRGAGQSTSSYARMIVRIAESQTQNYPWVTAHVTGAYSDLRERLTAMANLQTQRGQWRWLGGGLGLLIVAALVLPVRLVEADDAPSSGSGSLGGSGSPSVKKKSKIKKSASASASASSSASGGAGFNGIVAQNQFGGSGAGGGPASGLGGGAAFGSVEVKASASASTGDDDDSDVKPAKPSIGPSPGAPAAKPAPADNISIVTRKVGRKRTTTVTEDERTIVLTDSPNRIAINIIDESADPPKVTHFAAENEEALAKKHPQAFELYRKYVLERREGAADGKLGTAGGGERILGGGGSGSIGGGAVGGSIGGGGGAIFGGGGALGGKAGGGGGGLSGAVDLGGGGALGGKADASGGGLSGTIDLGGGGALGGKAGGGDAARLMREQLQKLRDEADTDDLRKLIDQALEQVK